MSNEISQTLLAEFYKQDSSDPFIMLLTLSHPSFDDIRLVNNTVDVTSRGEVYQAFPMNITLPSDDGESTREVSIVFDNVSLDLISEFRSITTPMDAKIEMVLASNLDSVEMSLEELKLRGISYDKQAISAKLYMDSFLNVELTSEQYTPSLYPALF